MTLRVGFVTGSTPDKWARRWRDQGRERLELVPVTEQQQERLLREAHLDMCLVRLPVDRTGLHVVELYDEQAVVVVSREHIVTAVAEVELADLEEEQLVMPHRSGWTPSTQQLPWPAMSEQDAVETVATGSGVAILPMSVARLLGRRDVAVRPVVDVRPTTVALAWLRERDDETTQAFVGVVRGRTARSSRG